MRKIKDGNVGFLDSHFALCSAFAGEALGRVEGDYWYTLRHYIYKTTLFVIYYIYFKYSLSQ